MAQRNQINVLSYNIHHGAGMDGILDLERIANVILSAKPDIVALQEVDCFTNRTGKVDQAQVLADLTEMNVVFCPSIDYDGGQYGNALLTRYPVVESQRVVLPGKESRSAMRVAVELGDGCRFNAIATHFSLIRDLRWESVSLINELAAGIPADQAAVLAGDLNTIPQSETIRMFRETWDVVGFGKDLKSYPADGPKEQIDYIMVRPANLISASRAYLLDEQVASDHRPISAVFTLR